MKRRQAFERIAGQLLSEAGQTNVRGRDDIIQALRNKSMTVKTKWGLVILPEDLSPIEHMPCDVAGVPYGALYI